jgi:hypothetical protein
VAERRASLLTASLPAPGRWRLRSLLSDLVDSRLPPARSAQPILCLCRFHDDSIIDRRFFMQGHRVASVLAVLGASLVLAACGGGSSEGEIMDKAETAAKGGGGGGGGTKSATLVADAGVASLMLAWNDTGAQQYNVYLSSSPGCDIKQYTLCPDGKMLANVRSPLKAGALVNGRVYYAQVESVTNRSASLSNEAAARPTTLEFNDTVWSIAAAADGTKYLGGDFTRVGLTSGQGVALGRALPASRSSATAA